MFDAIEADSERKRLYERYYTDAAIYGGEITVTDGNVERKKKVIGFKTMYSNLSRWDIDEIRNNYLDRLAFGKTTNFFGIILEKAMLIASNNKLPNQQEAQFQH